MDFRYSDDQAAVIELARQILEDHCSQEALQATERSGGPRFDPGLWDKLVEAGLVGVVVPEEFGGAGLGFLEITGILEEVGRSVAPVPLLESSVLGAMPLVQFGNDAQKEAWLPGIARGETIVTSALVEPFREIDEPGTTARAEGDGWVLEGEKICVPAGPLADAILVPARLGDDVAVFLVRAGVSGLTREDLKTTSAQPESAFALTGVRVGGDALLGDASQGREIVRWIALRATAALSALAAGVCREALRLTAEYTKTRKQFDQPIATFQAVGQRAADAFIDTEAVRLTSLQAAWRIHEGKSAAAETAVAKAWAADGGARIVRAAVHLHGGVGVDREYPLHRYYLYARHIELTLGGESQQLRRLGKLIAADAA
ncbi:MAG: acyl-CoA/acyl-ACP dehydrogenase [bacterium]|nr:acyl-CoA/acyl-ACP dehydrogenase [bacterium]